MAEAELLWAKQIPDILPAGEIDGVIVYAAEPATTICHEVYHVRFMPAPFNAFKKALKVGEFTTIMQVLNENSATALEYKPVFQMGEDTFVGGVVAKERLKEAWGKAGNTKPYHAVTLVTKKNYREESLNLQGKAIAAVAGYDIDNLSVISLEDYHSECFAITVLAVNN
ncbi:MAG: hypothetical protein D3924_09545 [Candidatus Electrothrix sp. AR4]|nr:hypothetical protein [Candidatus Electrothrix sp. AR4]